MSITILMGALLAISSDEWRNLFRELNSPAFAVNRFITTCLEYPELSKLQQACFQRFAAKLAAEYPQGVDAVLEGTQNRVYLRVCHEFMHYFGWELFQKTKDLPSAFRHGFDHCNGGLYHGIMEAYLNSVKISGNYSSDALKQTAQQACESVVADPLLHDGYRSVCYHGLGHGFMFLTDNDLPVSLSYCDFGPEGFAESCYWGVYMENSFSSAVPAWASHPTKYRVNLEDPTFPCRILAEHYQPSCYGYQGIVLLDFYDYDWVKGFSACNLFPKEYRDGCMLGLGGNVPAPSLTLEEEANICKKVISVGDREYRYCVKGAVGNLISHEAGRAGPMIKFCGLVEKQEQELCAYETGKAFKRWITPTDSIEEKCSLFAEASLRKTCLKGTL